MTISQSKSDSYDFGAEEAPLLEVSDLHVEFHTHHGAVHAVNGVSYELRRGETLGTLGESGSGKSVGVQAVMGLVQSPPGYVSGQYVRYRGVDLLTAPKSTLQNIRGQGISMVFQDALTSLNPGLSVGFQIGEMYRIRRQVSRKQARQKAIELMDRVHIPSARQRVGDYPHQFSGGMRQRVMIAIALALDPEILIADEPTTALDVTVQRQIMKLLSELQADTGMALLLITHDLSVIAEEADRVMVMYAGRIVETGSVEEIFAKPAHPYTIGLMKSIPHIDQKKGRLEPITGSPPVLTHIPTGCAFHPRCSWKQDICMEVIPTLSAVSPGRGSACHFYKEVLNG